MTERVVRAAREFMEAHDEAKGMWAEGGKESSRIFVARMNGLLAELRAALAEASDVTTSQLPEGQ